MSQQLGLRVSNDIKKQLRIIAAHKEQTITELVIEYILNGLKLDAQKLTVTKTV